MKKYLLLRAARLDRRNLPVPRGISTKSDAAPILPRTPVEEILCGIWCKVLGTEKVSVNDDFFSIGGHSLLATRIIYLISDAFSMELPVSAIFESPTIAGLSKCIEANKGNARPAMRIVPVTQTNGIPMSCGQERLWFMQQLEEGGCAYNMPVVLHIRGPLDPHILNKSFTEIVRRHEVLRTTFTTRNENTIQVVNPDPDISVELKDLRQLQQNEQATMVAQLAKQEADTEFDLTGDFMIRVTLLHLDHEEYVLLLTLHHIASDGWSIDILKRELSILYSSFLKGESSPLSELQIQFADFAYWERQCIEKNILEKQLDYWKRQLADIPTRLELPADRPRPRIQTYNGRVEQFVINHDITVSLEKLSRECGSTMFITLLAAFSILLHRYSAATDIAVGTPIANRNRSELEPLIGFFVNTLVLRADLTGNPTFKSLYLTVCVK